MFFMTADELSITEPQRDALIKVLGLFEEGKMVHVKNISSLRDSYTPGKKRIFSHQFNMADWSYPHSCGTICCIGGTAELIGGVSFEHDNDGVRFGTALYGLFYPQDLCGLGGYEEITPAQAARALRSYLTVGRAKWSEAIAA